jgi:hypothetical protein
MSNLPFNIADLCGIMMNAAPKPEPERVKYDNPIQCTGACACVGRKPWQRIGCWSNTTSGQ